VEPPPRRVREPVDARAEGLEPAVDQREDLDVVGVSLQEAEPRRGD